MCKVVGGLRGNIHPFNISDSQSVRLLVSHSIIYLERIIYSCGMSFTWKGSKFNRIVPLKSTGSCGMIETPDRKASKPTHATSTPSTAIVPLSSSVRRKSARSNEDFPVKKGKERG